MRIGNREFDTHQGAYIMGILNITPDSFSDGGKWTQMDHALAHAEEMIRQGADILDVGGESTRPGHQQISEEEEINRVAPVIQAIRERFDVPLSVDTYKASVAEAALSAGADLINDIWGLKYDDRMGEVIAAHGVPCCLMHNRDNTEYQELMPDLLEDLRASLALADRAGISREQIILDPGIGFGKTREQRPGGLCRAGRTAADFGVSGAARHLPKVGDRPNFGSAGGRARGGYHRHFGDRADPGLHVFPSPRCKRKSEGYPDGPSRGLSYVVVSASADMRVCFIRNLRLL